MKTVLKFYLIWLIPCVSYLLGEILLAYEQSDLDQLAKTRKCISCDFRDADFSMAAASPSAPFGCPWPTAALLSTPETMPSDAPRS